MPRINGSLLDTYLAEGWYRMGQIIFTTDYLQREEQLLRVLWLRYRLSGFQFTRARQKLLALPAGWSVDLTPFSRTAELENLYTTYRQSVDFEISQTLEDSLFSLGFAGNEQQPVFESYCIEFRNQGQLMAAGIFDKGEKSIMGILNFYDPACRKISPGKRLIYYKLQYALQQGMDYYYPGYIVPALPKFNYKLDPGTDCCELYDPVTKNWYPYSSLRELLKLQPPETTP